jgi:hypothetical protein
MHKCLIITFGYFGDIFFQSSIAKKLKEEKKFDEIEYVIAFPQIYRLLSNNPYIDKVRLLPFPTPYPTVPEDILENYDEVINMKPFSFLEPPPLECQKWASVKNPDTEFTVYTDSSYDEVAKNIIDELRKNGKKVVAHAANWSERSFLFTKKEYELGIDVPDFGYGGKHRNTNYILSCLSDTFNFVEIGFPPKTPQVSTISITDGNQKSLLFECSLMKHCDVFLGAEGGLCNMACGVGCRTITTGDFVLQLYGWNGVIKKIKEPKLGPIYYFKDKRHIVLDPYLTDDEVIDEIKKIMK